MSGENERTTVIASARTAFEADVIAQALQTEGFNARVIDTANAALWGDAGAAISQPKVIVLEHEAAAARVALSKIRFEGQSIDWDAIDVGQPVDLPHAHRWSRSRRAMWTVALVILPPAGLVTLMFGVQHGDPVAQLIGSATLATALIIVFVLMGSSPGRRKNPADAAPDTSDE